MPTAAVALLLAAKPVEGQGWIGHWSPGIGDPSPMGWVTVALYLVAAWLCFLSARRSRALDPPASPGRWEPRLWALFAVVLLALGVNKQLDLQTAFTEVMRIVAREQGWYETRRQYQYAFIGAAAVLATCASVALIAATWRLSRALKLAAVGLVFVLAFVTVRAMSFHHVDALIGTHVLHVRVNWMLEIGGIAVVIAGCVLGLRRSAGVGWSRAFLELAGSAPDFDIGDRTAEHERGDVLSGATADPSGPGRRKSLRMTGGGRGGSCR